jgi:hypothetical protein
MFDTMNILLVTELEGIIKKDKAIRNINGNNL